MAPRGLGQTGRADQEERVLERRRGGGPRSSPPADPSSAIVERYLAFTGLLKANNRAIGDHGRSMLVSEARWR